MNINLVVANGPNKSRKIALKTSEAIIGRRRGSQVRIPSAEVSRNHCRLSAQDGYLIVEDLDSFNGTYLNGERVGKARPVRPGDRLGVGPVSFVVEYELTQVALQALMQRFPSAAAAEPEPESDEVVQPVLLPDDDELPVKLLEDEPEELVQPILLSEQEVLSEVVDPGTGEITADFDEGSPWQLPDPDQLRDILKKMDKPK